jgi:hypothetical protein
MMESGKALYIITQIASLFSKDPTTLRQEMPCVCAPSVEQMVPYLDFKDHEYLSLLEEAKKKWGVKNENIFGKQESEPIIKPNTLLASLIHYVDQPLNTVEKNLKEGIQTTFNEVVDEVDQESIKQITSVGQNVWEYIGPWIKKRLIDGALFSYIDRQQFQKAAEFSFLNFFYHESSLRTHRTLLTLAPSCYVTRKKDDIIKENEQDALKRFWLWHHRWYDTYKMNNKLHHLYNLQSFYHEKFSQAIEAFEQVQNQKEGNLKNQEDFAFLAYHYLTQRNIIIDATCELQAAHHNKLAKNREIGWFNSLLEQGLNSIAGWFQRFGYFRMPRDFEVCLEHCEKLIQEGNESLFEYNLRFNQEELPEDYKKYIEKEFLLVERTKKAKIDELLTLYINAVMEDNFFKAKELCTWYVTEESKFNWVEEYENFENYRRELSKIFQYQDMFHEILARLYLLGDQYYGKDSSSYNKIILLQDEIKKQVMQLHFHHRELKKSFINLIKTHSNNADKGIVERISNSLSRKTLRYLSEGTIYHSIKPYDEQLDLAYKQIKNSFDLITQIKTYVTKTLKIDEIGETPVHQIKMYFDQMSLTPLHYQETFMPFLLTKETFHQHVTQKLRLDDLFEIRELKILGANILRNTHWSEEKIWSEFLQNFKIYFDGVRILNKQKKQLTSQHRLFLKFLNSLQNHEKYQETLKYQLKELTQAESELDKIYSGFQQSFKHTMNTIYNTNTLLNSERIFSSANRKISRLLTKGELYNSTPLLKDLSSEVKKQILKLTDFLKTKQQQIEEWQILLFKLSQQESQQNQTKEATKIVIIDNYL